MPKKKAPDSLRERLARVVVERALNKGYVGGWLDTLGQYGSPPKKGESAIPPATRVAAAKAGIDLVSKAMGDAGATGAGDDLLTALKRIRGEAEKLDEHEPESTKNGARPDDPDLGREVGDLGEDEGSLSGDQ